MATASCVSTICIASLVLLICISALIRVTYRMPLKPSIEARAAVAAPVCSGPRLLFHVGPAKTGTSALQHFLFTEQQWLEHSWNVGAAMNGVKTGQCLAWHVACKFGHEESCRKAVKRMRLDELNVTAQLESLESCAALILSLIKTKLRRHASVVFSSEALARLDARMWQYLKAMFQQDNDKPCLSAVVFHRAPVDWLASLWMQVAKQENAPRSWMEFLGQIRQIGSRDGGLVRPDAEGDVDLQLQLLNILMNAFPQAVDAASYDYLKEVNCSTAAFLICNATLRKTGQTWEICRDAINRKAAASIHVSPPLAAVDVLRLARAVKNATMTATQARLCKNLTIPLAGSPKVIKVASSLPLSCADLDDFFKPETDTWFVRTQAQRAQTRSKPFCSVAIDRLEPEHWQLIGSLVQGC
ncbi:unnamed protein product [Symbiodinium sp. CCMP2456]|nr:unnamed protein product [Symbiodinium sp. CCMP2456]